MASESDLIASQHQQQGVQLGQPSQQTPTLTRRIADLVFNPTSFSLFSLIGIPIALAAGYWLFVVNGPTPVVRAREGESGRMERGGQEYGLAQILEAVLSAIVEQSQQLE